VDIFEMTAMLQGRASETLAEIGEVLAELTGAARLPMRARAALEDAVAEAALAKEQAREILRLASTRFFLRPA
jgi:hypothetical protein